jgi:hypothetical protein
MDFGENGDRETKNKSQLVLFEDGKPLGPARSLHAHIREQGGGRYSHWTRTALYMSASDNSDPRTNGRTYEVGSPNPGNTLGGLEDLAGPVKEHVEEITAGAHSYTVAMGGTLDFENCHTRNNGGFDVPFQPNVSLSIENVGDTVVVWPRILTNGLRDWRSLDALVADFTRGAVTDQEKALFIWEAARSNRYHCLPLFANNEFHDPVKMFNSYGLNLCDDMGYCGVVLFRHAGLGKPNAPEDPFVRALYGHVQAEAPVNGQYQFLDIDESVFHLDRENRRIVSGDECARDHDLVRREVHYGPVFGGWQGSEANAALFGDDDTKHSRFIQGHTMEYRLRPDEGVYLRWDNIGKFACESEKWKRRPPYFGNSRFVFTPRLTEGDAHRDAEVARGLVAAAAPVSGLCGVGSDAELAYRIASPWVICGGRIQASFEGGGAGARMAVEVRLPDAEPQTVWQGTGPGPHRVDVAIDDALQPHSAPAKYAYMVAVKFSSPDNSPGAALTALRMETDIMTAPLSLPRLKLGTNTVAYEDDSAAERRVRVTHRWRECDALQPPLAPSAPQHPKPGETVAESIVPFAWEPVPDCTAYHLQVSLREDFRVPYRPNYDVIVDSPTWTVPYRGMFSPDTLYRWRVRARHARGVWGAWSPVWTFRWQGPCVPLDCTSEAVGDTVVLRWGANPRGTRPVRFDVYGSDEKGFSVNREVHVSYTRGEVPGNFLGSTTGTEMTVVSPAPSHANMNRCFYRVVAVDAAGVESICSDFVEMPHPHIWSSPVREAAAGQPYRYELGVLRSLGDVQHRYESPNNGFWDTEKLTFNLVDAPEWLSIDSETGVLQGTPPGPATTRVTVRVATQFDQAVTQSFDLRIR